MGKHEIVNVWAKVDESETTRVEIDEQAVEESSRVVVPEPEMSININVLKED